MTHDADTLTRTILLVDDDDDVRHTLAGKLEAEGWRVITEKDGEWAVRAFERLPIDAIVLDILIPIKSGLEVAREIRATARGQRVGIVMLTGVYRDPKDRERAIKEYDLLEYLPKPADAQRIVDLFHEYFKQTAAATKAEDDTPLRALNDDLQKKEKREVERAARKVGSTPTPKKGNLKDLPFPELLSRLYRQRTTGALFLLNGKTKKIVFLRDGHPFYCKSNQLDEALGRILVTERMITAKECEASVVRMKEEKRLQGTVLIEMGVLSPHGLRSALDRQLRLKIFGAFYWTDGDYLIRDDVAMPDNVITLGMSNAQLIFEGIRLAYDETRLDAALAPIADRFLKHAKEPTLRYQDMNLTSAETRYIDHIDGQQTATEVTDQAPPTLRGAKAKSLLYALSVAGVIDAEQQASTSSRRIESTPPLGISESQLSDAKVAGFVAKHRDADSYAVLGVEKHAPAEEIRGAYESLAKEFHADRFRDQPETLAAIAREAFVLVTVAYERIESGDTKSRAHTRPSTEPGSAQDPASRALAADVLFRRGEQHLRAHSFAEAESLFRQASSLRTDHGAYHAFWGWATFCTTSQAPEDAGPALKILEDAVKLGPRLEHPHLFLGMVYNAVQRQDVAEREFEKALTCNPDSVKALRELRLLHQQRAAKRK